MFFSWINPLAQVSVTLTLPTMLQERVHTVHQWIKLLKISTSLLKNSINPMMDVSNNLIFLLIKNSSSSEKVMLVSMLLPLLRKSKNNKKMEDSLKDLKVSVLVMDSLTLTSFSLKSVNMLTILVLLIIKKDPRLNK